FSPPFHFLLLCSTQPKRKLFPYTTLFRSKQSSVIGITISHGFEWNTKSIIEAAWQNGKKVCVPKCQPKERKMDFYLINNYDQLEVVYYNLQEPKLEETEKIRSEEHTSELQSRFDL